MARGKPAYWSAVVALPFLFSTYTQIPTSVSILSALFGLSIVIIGVYVRSVSIPKPRMAGNEELIKSQHPSQRVATAKIVASVPFLLATAYLFFYTVVPYVYPTVTFLIGLFYFSTGMYRYWSNTLTCYYITDRRVIRTFKFISKVNQELPLDKVRGIQERRSITEALVGLGNVRVASGAGGKTLEVVVRNIYDPDEFANELRDLI
jgi:hypothetical protein